MGCISLVSDLNSPKRMMIYFLRDTHKPFQVLDPVHEYTKMQISVKV